MGNTHFMVLNRTIGCFFLNKACCVLPPPSQFESLESVLFLLVGPHTEAVSDFML